MHAQSNQKEIEQLTRRLATLQELAKDQFRQRLKEARKVVTNLEMQLSEITGRSTAIEIKIALRH